MYKLGILLQLLFFNFSFQVTLFQEIVNGLLRHTYPDIFENASFFIHFGLASTQRRHFWSPKQSFLKTLFRVDLFENAIFMSSYGRVKAELFENADVTASISTYESMRTDLRGSRKGILVVCFLL